MTNPFSNTDLARLVELPVPARILGLLASLRFVALPDLAVVGVVPQEVDTLLERGLVLRLRLQRRLIEKETVEVLALCRGGAVDLACELDLDSASVPYSTRSSCNRSTMFLDHQLALSRFALLLARDLAGPATPGRLLSWETDPDRLADAVHLMRDPNHLGRQPLVADGLAVLQTSHGVEGLLIEIDRGTEKPGYLGKKYAGYLAWWREGGPLRKFSIKAMRLLTVAPDAKRMERLRQACKEATDGRASGLFWFASEDDLARQGVVAPVWSTTRDAKLSLWP